MYWSLITCAYEVAESVGDKLFHPFKDTVYLPGAENAT